MTDAIETRDLQQTAAQPEPPADDSPTPPPLIVFEGDADLVCVDNTCLPPGLAR